MLYYKWQSNITFSKVSEFLENLEEMFPRSYMHHDVFIRYKSSSTYWCVSRRWLRTSFQILPCWYLTSLVGLLFVDSCEFSEHFAIRDCFWYLMTVLLCKYTKWTFFQYLWILFHSSGCFFICAKLMCLKSWRLFCHIWEATVVFV